MGQKVAFLGLGVMGYPMAGHLARAGHRVTVFNRTKARAQGWLTHQRTADEHGDDSRLAVADTPRDAAKEAEVVFACVGADPDLREICLGEDGAFGGMAEGTVFVDHTTASAEVARELAAAARERGLGFLDAPVSGGEAGAVNGQLTVMVGGEADQFEAVGPLIDCYARKVALMGPVGAGQTTKMVNQICIAGVLQGLAEAVHFAMEAGLDAGAVIDVISKGAAQSWQMDNRARTMADGEFDFGFAVDWMRKDLEIVLNEARRLGLSLPMTALVDQFYADVQAMDGGRNDTSSLIRRFRG